MLPKKGEVKYDKEGKLICHICGKSYDRLLTHVRQAHNIKARDYKLMFGLDVTKGLISNRTRLKSKQAVLNNYDLVVKHNLIEKGKKCRYVKGVKRKEKRYISEQSKIRLAKQLNFV